MWQLRREDPQCKAPSPFERNATPEPGLFGQHSHGDAATGATPFGPTWGDPAPWRAHWAEAEKKSDDHSGFGGFLRNAGSTVLSGLDSIKSGAQWLGGQVGKGAAWVGNQASEGWQSAKDGIGQTAQDGRHAIDQEGFGEAFLDSRGALDRQRAQRELSDRFQVVPNDFVGPRLPNQVTEKEYAQVARTYSDIRLGRGDLTIDASAYNSGQQRDAYQAGALEDVASLMQTRSGRREIEQLHDNVLRDEAGTERCGILGIPTSCMIGSPIHHHTTMVPYLEKNGLPSLTNGQARPDGKGDARNILGDGSLGAAGQGTDAHIQYNPGVKVGRSLAHLAPTNPWLAEMRSDILLAHEMNHAIQQTQGMADYRRIRSTDDVRNREDPAMAHDATAVDDLGRPINRIEHQAVGLGIYADADMSENRYRAERRDIAASQGKGQLDGDATLHQRNAYAIWDVPKPLAADPGSETVPIPDTHGHNHSHGKHRKPRPHR